MISPEGKLTYSSFTRHRAAAADIVKSKWSEEFEKSHKNRHYDEIEFLIIVKGYISIHSGYARYCGIPTKKQIKVFVDAGEKNPLLK